VVIKSECVNVVGFKEHAFKISIDVFGSSESGRFQVKSTRQRPRTNEGGSNCGMDRGRGGTAHGTFRNNGSCILW